MSAGETFEACYEVEDGYVGKRRPKTFKIYANHLDEDLSEGNLKSCTMSWWKIIFGKTSFPPLNAKGSLCNGLKSGLPLWILTDTAMRNEKEDLKKLASAFFDELTIVHIEYGGIGLDPKRPFGNSDVEADILEIIEWEPEQQDDNSWSWEGGACYSTAQRDYARILYTEKLIPCLKDFWHNHPHYLD